LKIDCNRNACSVLGFNADTPKFFSQISQISQINIDIITAKENLRNFRAEGIPSGKIREKKVNQRFPRDQRDRREKKPR